MLIKRRFLFGTTVLASLVALAAPAFAQSAQSPQSGDEEQETQVEEVVVTGSRIRRDPTTAPTPLIQVSREQLLETGLATVIDYLATIPALSNSLVPSDTTGGGLNTGGLEFANLRSLGSGRTLTLVDGRRHVGSQGGSLAVDVSTIPRLLIQNIEIITGGGSSVYGADAVSGVVNYILRKDFEGLEIDGNYGQLVQDGAADTRRVSILGGMNFFDDRLNVYAHAEYERAETVFPSHINWLQDGRTRLGVDADPTNPAFGPAADGVLDTGQFYNARRLDRPQWGSLTIANMQRPSPNNDPDVPFSNCTGLSTAAACFSVDPAYTYWFTGTTARLANFGERIGATGANRPWNIGGDGEPANQSSFDRGATFPFQESQRYQVGLNFDVTEDINLSLEAKYTTEDAFFAGQLSFWDIYVSNASLASGTGTATTPGLISGTATFSTRLDNAFLPANVRSAILANTFTAYGQPSVTDPTQPGAVIGTRSGAIANHRGFGIARDQTNTREVARYVAAIDGTRDSLGFIDNVSWNLSYTYGEMNNLNIERGPDAIRFGHAMDSVVDTAGIVNGSPGEIVCRVQLLRSQGLDVREQNPFTARTSYGVGTAINDPEVNGCVPLNVFGAGNQSQEALDYISAFVTVEEKNVQEAAVASFGGQLWDFWGAGPIGFAVGGEYRREFTEGVGRSASANNRVLQLNTGADFIGVEYESEELFAEIAIPLFRDTWLGEFAELTASYRSFDYTTAGTGDVYGVNLVYRPVKEITFKSSFNTSFRAPNLTENFRPFAQTFVNAFVDPCDTRQITGFSGANAAEVRANRIANCTALAAEAGLSFDFANTTISQADDYLPVYGSGIASSLGGNPFLRPETSESFTFSTVLEPSFIPDLNIILDYYEITIEDVIITPSGQFLANDCVSSGPTPNPITCAFVFRNNPNNGVDPFNTFKVGAPNGDPVGGFILAGINNAKLQTRGLDFSVNYRLDLPEVMGRDVGRLNWSLGGLWLIEQKNFTNPANPSAFTDSTTDVFFPRVEFVSRLTWTPIESFAVTWTADWSASQDLRKSRDVLVTGNTDIDSTSEWTTGNFARHDLSFRYDVTEEATLRVGVTNVFDSEPPPYLGFASNFDPYGRRFNVGINYRPF